MVVLRCDEHESVERLDRAHPCLSLWASGSAQGGRNHLVEEGEPELGEVDEPELGVGPLGRGLVDPLGDLGAEPSGPRTADDDADLGHDAFS